MRAIALVIGLGAAALPAPLWAKPKVPPSKVTFEIHPPLQFEKIGLKDGLPQQSIVAIAQDAIGFIWFGTQGGLARYDGRQVRSYKHDEEVGGSIAADFVTALEMDASGALWIGTGEAGLDKYDPDTDTFVHHRHSDQEPKSLSSDVIAALERDKEGRLWIGTGAGTVDVFEGGAFRHVLQTAKPITSLASDESGTLWIGTGGDGLYKLPKGSAEALRYVHDDASAESLAADMISAILVARDGTIWVGTTGGGLDQHDPKTAAFVHHRRNDRAGSLPDDRVTVLLEDHRGTIWVGMQIGLAALDRNLGRFTSFLPDLRSPEETSSYPYYVSTAFEDRGGVVWFGDLQNGARRFDEMRLRFGRHRGGAAKNGPDVLSEAPDGVIWGGTGSSGLYKYDLEARKVTAYTSLGAPDGPDHAKLESFWVSTVYAAKNHTVWFARDGLGLVRFDPKTEEHKIYRPSEDFLGADRIMRITEDESGGIWAATWGGGLSRLDPVTEKTERFEHDPYDEDSLGADHLYTVVADKNVPGVVWVGTAGGGLSRIDFLGKKQKRWVSEPDDPESLSDNEVLCIHQDSSGALWIGTDGGGLVRFDPKKGKGERFTRKKSGLTNDTIYGILEEDGGRLWLSTNGGGLMVFDPKTKSVVAKYDDSDGLQSNQFMQNGFMRRSSGQFFFIGSDGFNAFFPKEITKDSYSPGPVITSFRVFDEEVALPKAIWHNPDLHLSYKDSVISFRFATLSFAAPEKSRIEYMLEGHLTQWLSSDSGVVTYTKLEGGDYVLRVRAVNRHGVQSSGELALKMRIDPPIWKTRWAYALYFLFSAGTLTGVALVYAKRQKAKIEEQQRKIEELERQKRLKVLEKDLELAGAVQAGFLPKNARFSTPKVDVVGFYRPADKASGDWWWHERLGPKHAVLVGDVTGHGASSAIVTAAVATAFRVLGRGTAMTLQERLARLSDEVLATSEGNHQMAMTALELDEETGEIVLCYAGGLPVLRISRVRQDAYHAPSTPLGSVPFVTGEVREKLSGGDRLLVYTDGIPECTMPDGKQLGIRTLLRIWKESQEMSLEEAARHLVKSVDERRGDQVQDDDWTFTLIEYRS
jgi:ligand-binding sensor domain-containing protein/serine phosphatase RsbU (regulator of sigma subunit)